MTVFATFAAIGLLTYLMRSAVILDQGRVVSEAWIEKRIVYVTPAVLAALVSASLFTESGQAVVGNPAEIAAVVAGIAAARRFGNPAFALAAGLPVYWFVSALLG